MPIRTVSWWVSTLTGHLQAHHQRPISPKHYTWSQSRVGSLMPFLAEMIINLAIAMVAGSLRSTSPSLLSAASNAVVKFPMSSRPNAEGCSFLRIARIGTFSPSSLAERGVDEGWRIGHHQYRQRQQQLRHVHPKPVRGLFCPKGRCHDHPNPLLSKFFAGYLMI